MKKNKPKKTFYKPSEFEITEATAEFKKIIDYTMSKFPNDEPFMITKIILHNLKKDKRKELTKKLGIGNDDVIVAGWIMKYINGDNK